MSADTAQVRDALQDFDFKRLFVEELGWDRTSMRFDVTLIEPGQRGLGRRDAAEHKPADRLETHTFTLQAVAEKRGMTVFVCSPYREGSIPNAPTRFRLQHKVARMARENVVIFHNVDRTTQIWQWVHRAHGGPITVCEHSLTVAGSLTNMAERLRLLAIGVDEEYGGHIDLMEVTRRAFSAFYVHRERRPRARYGSVRLADYDFAYFDDSLRWWLEYVYGIPRLNRQQEAHLARAFRNGDINAQSTLIEANLYLVAEIAWKFACSVRTQTANVQDLMQSGHFGLIAALDLFNPDLGYRIQTFARRHILNHLVRAQRGLDRTVRLPTYVDDWLSVVMPTWEIERDTLWQLFEREPNRAEIASRFQFSRSEQKRLRVLDLGTVPLDVAVTGGHASLVDDDPAHDPLAVVMTREVRDTLGSLFDSLSARERSVIMARLGVDCGEPRTLEDIGNEFGLTRERIRQIEMQALRSLKFTAKRSGLVKLIFD